MTDVSVSSILIVVLALGLVLTGSDAHAAPGIAGMAHLRTGLASWYGQRFQGRRMADGCPFRAEELTAASSTLPIGAWVRVRRLHSQRWVIVPVTDRGPYVRGRIIDLSQAAAEALDMIAEGIVLVSVEPVGLKRVEGCQSDR